MFFILYIFSSDQEVGLHCTLHTDTFTVLYVLNKIIIITSLIFTADRIQAVCGLLSWISLCPSMYLYFVYLNTIY